MLSGSVSNKDVIEKAINVAAGYVEKRDEVVTLLQVRDSGASNQVLLRVRFAEVSRSAMTDLGISLFTGPNGHGGTLTALESSGLLDRLRSRGIRTVFYFQVDNPMVKVADLDFLGGHLAGNADVSAKVVPKETPEEKVGIFVLVDGRLTITLRVARRTTMNHSGRSLTFTTG